MFLAYEDVLTPGQKFQPIGSRFPFPFTVVRINPVKPEFTISETLPDYTKIERIVRFSVFMHSAKVWNVAVSR
jgi:hypothetical protein